MGTEEQQISICWTDKQKNHRSDQQRKNVEIDALPIREPEKLGRSNQYDIFLNK